MKQINLIWKYWKKIGKFTGHIQALIIFTIFYFVAFWAVGVTRIFNDPLNIKNKKLKSNFSAWTHNQDLLASKNPY